MLPQWAIKSPEQIHFICKSTFGLIAKRFQDKDKSCQDVEKVAKLVPRLRLALAVQGSSFQLAVFTVSFAVATTPRESVLVLPSTLLL